jgi:L-rhamnose mutarotase
MSQYAWVLEILPGCEDEYQKRHDEIRPDVVAETQAAGIRNYTIFRHGLTLFGYFETDNLERSIKLLCEGEANKRWDEYMGPIMKVEIDPTTNFPYLLPKIWRMEE